MANATFCYKKKYVMDGHFCTKMIMVIQKQLFLYKYFQFFSGFVELFQATSSSNQTLRNLHKYYIWI